MVIEIERCINCVAYQNLMILWEKGGIYMDLMLLGTCVTLGQEQQNIT